MRSCPIFPDSAFALLVMHCLEKRRSHGYPIDVPIVRRPLPPSPMGCAVQDLWSFDRYRNASSAQNPLAPFPFRPFHWSKHLLKVAMDSPPERISDLGSFSFHPLSHSSSFHPRAARMALASLELRWSPTWPNDLLADRADAWVWNPFHSSHSFP